MGSSHGLADGPEPVLSVAVGDAGAATPRPSLPAANTDAVRFEGQRLGLAVLAAVLVLGAALRVWLSFNDDGIYWPDEIYQSLEPAHRLVFGYGLIPWEFIEGARNWALPGMVAALLKISAVLGLDDPRQYLSVVRVAFSAIGVATAFGSYLLARRLGASWLFAACGAMLFGLVGPAIYFAPRALSESASALPVVFGLALALPSTSRRREYISGASLLGISVLLRLQNVVFCIGLIAVYAARRQWRQAAEATAVLSAWAIVFGLLDRLTWGDWFHSAIVYVRANLLPSMRPITGSLPVEYYTEMLLRSMPVVVIVVAVLVALAAPRARGLLAITIAFVLVHSLLPTKAFRYILPALPLFGSLAALGLEEIRRRGRLELAYGAAAVLGASVLWSAVTFHDLTWGNIGPYEQTRAPESAYDDKGPVNRLLIAAGRRPDLCGLKVETDQLVWIGGYTYLHRPVPLYPMTGPARESGLYNYVIAAAGSDVAGVVAEDANRILVRLPNASCVPDPNYDPRLPGWEQVHQALQ